MMDSPTNYREAAYDKAVKLVFTHGKTFCQAKSIVNYGTTVSTLSRRKDPLKTRINLTESFQNKFVDPFSPLMKRKVS